MLKFAAWTANIKNKLEHYLLSLKYVRVQSRNNFTGCYQYSISDYLHYWQTRFNYVSINGHIEKDVSNAFNKLKITRDERKIDDVSDETLSLFKPKILNAIDQIKQKKKRPDLNTIYEYLSKTEASNTDKQLIETILANLVETNIIVNRKTPKGMIRFRN